jgi:hypothetical protein
MQADLGCCTGSCTPWSCWASPFPVRSRKRSSASLPGTVHYLFPPSRFMELLGESISSQEQEKKDRQLPCQVPYITYFLLLASWSCWASLFPVRSRKRSSASLAAVLWIRIRMFWPPVCGSVSQRYGSGSFYCKQNVYDLDSYCHVTSLFLFILEK